MKRSKSTDQRRTASFRKHDFDQLFLHVAKLARACVIIDPEQFYLEVKKHRGKSRDLSLEDLALKQALTNDLEVRLKQEPQAKKTDPLFLSQKGAPYSPNTLQEHVVLMQCVGWHREGFLSQWTINLWKSDDRQLAKVDLCYDGKAAKRPKITKPYDRKNDKNHDDRVILNTDSDQHSSEYLLLKFCHTQ